VIKTLTFEKIMLYTKVARFHQMHQTAILFDEGRRFFVPNFY